MDMTAKLFECDRDEMYNYLLRLCSKSFPFICLCALLFGFSVCGFDLLIAFSQHGALCQKLLS